MPKLQHSDDEETFSLLTRPTAQSPGALPNRGISNLRSCSLVRQASRELGRAFSPGRSRVRDKAPPLLGHDGSTQSSGICEMEEFTTNQLPAASETDDPPSANDAPGGPDGLRLVDVTVGHRGSVSPISEGEEDPLYHTAEYRNLFEQTGRVIPEDIRQSAGVERGERQALLRRIVGAIAYDLADLFGFQKLHVIDTEEGPPQQVLSSVANQVEHLVALLSNRMDACEGEVLHGQRGMRASGTSQLPRRRPKEFIEQLYDAIGALHAKVFTNYENWVARLGLLPRKDDGKLAEAEINGDPYLSLGHYDVALSDFKSLQEGYAWVHNAQLHRLVLFFLMHGEAANLRHLPECLCFIFYGMAHSVLLLDTRTHLEWSGVDFQEVVSYPYRLGRGACPEHDFLNSIVAKLYDFVEHEVFKRKDEPVEERVMYDDITECFWQRPMVDLLLPAATPGCKSADHDIAAHAYGHLQRLLANPILVAQELVRDGLLPADAISKPGQHALRSFFGKTYHERPGWAHCYHVFGRILLWHAICFHAAIMGTFYGWKWQNLNTVCITHALGKVLRQLVDMWIGHPPRDAQSKVFGFRSSSQSFTEHITLITLFLFVPVTYVLEKSLRRNQLTTLYDVAAIVYVATFAGSYVVHTRPGHRLRSLWRSSREQHIGRDDQLRVPLGNFVIYCSFWAVVLGAKLAFDIFLIVLPLKEPVDGLLGYPFPRIQWVGCPSQSFKSAQHGQWFCVLYEQGLRWTLVILRFSVPLLVFYFDTYIFFNVGSAIFSSLIALRRKIGVVSHWRHLVTYLPENVRDFNVKLLGTSNGDSARAADAALRSGKLDWCVEARSLEWQCYARGWNSIVEGLRQADSLSNRERDELCFSWISGAESEIFFDVPEYVIFPTFVTSPVLATSAVGNQQSARSSWHRLYAYPSFARTMLQTRDLLIWLLVQLGVVPAARRSALLEAITLLASLEAKHLLHRPHSKERAKSMCRAVGNFVQFLHEQLEQVATDEQARQMSNSSSRRAGSMPGLLSMQAESGSCDSIAGSTDTAHRGSPCSLARNSQGERGQAEPSEMANELALRAEFLLQRMRQVFVDGFNARTVASTTDGPYRECVDAWAKLLELVPFADSGKVVQCRIDRAWPTAIRKPAVADVIRALHRSFWTSNPGCEPKNSEAKRQLLFFCNSLFNTRLKKPPRISHMKSWTAFTPHYAEDVTYSMASLREEKEGVNGTLQLLLTSLFPEEWDHFCERVGILPTAAKMPRFRALGLKWQHVGFSRPVEGAELQHPALVDALATKCEFTQTEFDAFDLPDVRTDDFVQVGSSYYQPLGLDHELQRWASDRAQVLSRTVRGVMRYSESLRVLARLEGVDESEVEMVVADKFEYIITCQIYGKLKGAPENSADWWKAKSIDELRQQYSHHLRVAYVEQGHPTDAAHRPFYSVLLGVDPTTNKDRVLYKVRLPGNPILGEGKPENQNHAIIFTRGEHLQTLDMNQDNYMGESYKMRNLLECFRDRVRIVGFREHIFSESGGAVAKFAASNEFVFGTMVQRFLTWPLMVRFHYGHPDVWDKVWVMGNGGVSKASRTLHVSEDIFAGFNAVLRGGHVEYLEYIHCGKGRDMGFTAVNGFEQKISAGNALQCTSRDLYRLGKRFDLARLMSFYFSGAGFYITTMMTIQAVFFFTLTQLVLALCGAELFEYDYELTEPISLKISHRRLQQQDITFASNPQAVTHVTSLHPHELARSGDTLAGLGALNISESPTLVSASGSIYSAAYVLQLGFAMMLPYAMELWVESSLWRAISGTLRMVAGLSFVFSLFTMQTKGFHFSNAIKFGRAGYVATGRGFQMDTLSLIELYAKYATSHIHQGFEIMLYLVLFWCVTEQDPSVYVIASIPTLVLVVAFMFSPWIFNPGALTFSSIAAAWQDWRLWIDSDECRFEAADINWRVFHRKRMASARGERCLGKIALGVQIAFPRLIVVVGCTAYLRRSLVLQKYDPSWSLAIVLVGAFELFAFALVSLYLQRLLVESPYLERWVFPKRSYARFVGMQILRAAPILGWLTINWRIWEAYCWQLSCSQEEAARRVCDFDLFGQTGAVRGYTCFIPSPDTSRWCARNCTHPSVLGLDDIQTRCVRDGAYTQCLDQGGAALSCATAHADPIELRDYGLCMYETPSLGVALGAAIAIVVLLVQWLALVDSPGWLSWLDGHERAKASSRALVAFTTCVGVIADDFYKMFDMIVTLILFLLLGVLTSLPLHAAQSILLFNASFSRLIQRSVRSKDFLDELYK